LFDHRSSNVFLLTATIQPPPGVPGLDRTDPTDRMNDYVRALEFYCNMPESIVTRIIFVENSNSDLSPLRDVVARAKASNRVEFLSFNGLDHPSSYGRGYGEFKLLDHAVDYSSTLADAPSTSVLWKITGRYRVLNLARIIRGAPKDFELYCDTRKWPMQWVDLRIFGCTIGGYQRLLKGIYPQLNETLINMAPEQYLFSIITTLAQSQKIVTRFNNEPLVDGIRGKDSQNYASGLNFIKYLLRSSRRIFLS
jgi:hypothetical protein